MCIASDDVIFQKDTDKDYDVLQKLDPGQIDWPINKIVLDLFFRLYVFMSNFPLFSRMPLCCLNGKKQKLLQLVSLPIPLQCFCPEIFMLLFFAIHNCTLSTERGSCYTTIVKLYIQFSLHVDENPTQSVKERQKLVVTISKITLSFALKVCAMLYVDICSMNKLRIGMLKKKLSVFEMV
ncbi:hypothetical protein T06_2499 [Trichinella sp. T6]|nr:hypothetical protein T06_2499 [Trichinella sp. T6]